MERLVLVLNFQLVLAHVHSRWGLVGEVAREGEPESPTSPAWIFLNHDASPCGSHKNLFPRRGL